MIGKSQHGTRVREERVPCGQMGLTAGLWITGSILCKEREQEASQSEWGGEGSGGMWLEKKWKIQLKMQIRARYGKQ